MRRLLAISAIVAAAGPPRLAYMAIPGAKGETASPRACWTAPKSWREGLVDAYEGSVVVCSPEALRINETCACRVCPENTCVARIELAKLELDHALGIGSGRDADALREFYRLTRNATLVTNVPISEHTDRDERWGSLVDVVMSFLRAPKPPLKVRPCARRDRRCADALQMSHYEGALACRAAFVGSVQPTKVPLAFFRKLGAKANGQAFLQRFAWHFYGADRGNHSAHVQALLDTMNLSSTFHGRVDDVQAAYCSSDVLIAFPVHDRNPRVPTEALRAGRPVFASTEANLAPVVSGQPVVGTASHRASRFDLLAAFTSWARNATSIAPEVFEDFASNCLDRGVHFARVWRVLDRVKDGKKGKRRAVACEAPGACLRPTAGAGPPVEDAARACLGLS
jgi:hypothetical protein